MGEPQELKANDAGADATASTGSDSAGCIATALADLQETEVLDTVRLRMARGDDPLQIIEDCQAGMREVGERYAASGVLPLGSHHGRRHPPGGNGAGPAVD